VPLTPAIENELRQMLRAFRAAHSGAVAPSGQGKALEAWVLMRLAHTVRISMPTWQVTLRRGDGTPLLAGSSFDLPSQRSRIQPSSPTAPGYVLLEHRDHADRKLELRGSLQWMGRSGALHECDVSVVPAAIGAAIRMNGGGYPHGLPIVAIECKDRTGIGPLDETRQTLARMYDLVLVTRPAAGTSCRIYETQTHQRWGRWSSKYVSFFSKGLFAIVRAGIFQSGAGTLGSHYHIQHRARIYSDPIGMPALEQGFRFTLAQVGSF
jgi:hypothetical protein